MVVSIFDYISQQKNRIRIEQIKTDETVNTRLEPSYLSQTLAVQKEPTVRNPFHCSICSCLTVTLLVTTCRHSFFVSPFLSHLNVTSMVTSCYLMSLLLYGNNIPCLFLSIIKWTCYYTPFHYIT